MDPKVMLLDLEMLAERIGFTVRYERFGEDEAEVRSGRCRLRGEDIILVDRRLDMNARIAILSRELKNLNLAGVYVKPYLRALLEESPETTD